MVKVVIIGNSAAGFSACRALLDSPLKFELTVVSKEAYPAYSRDRLVDYLAGTIEEKDIFLTGEDFYKSNSVTLLKGCEAVKIDTKRKSVVLKDKTKLTYDYLIIASGQKVNLPELPGKGKEGIFCLYELSEAVKIKESLLLPHTVCVAGQPQLAARIAEAVAPRGKEVKLISGDALLAPAGADNIEVISGVGLQEFIGEGAELQALKLTNGKVIGTTLVILAGPYAPAAAFLKESEIAVSGGYINVNSAMRTNVENVFACGSIAADGDTGVRQKLWQDCVNEGIMAAQSIINRETQDVAGTG